MDEKTNIEVTVIETGGAKVTWSTDVDDLGDFTVSDTNVLALLNSKNEIIAAYNPLAWSMIEVKR